MKNKKPKGGTKHDSGKPRLSLISSIALFKLAQVLTDGEIKYASHNWRQGFNWSRIVDAVERHLLMWSSGMDKDPDSGRSNLAGAMFGLMVLAEFEETKAGQDDRYKLPLDVLYKLYPPKETDTMFKVLKESLEEVHEYEKTANRKSKRKRSQQTGVSSLESWKKRTV